MEKNVLYNLLLMQAEAHLRPIPGTRNLFLIRYSFGGFLCVSDVINEKNINSELNKIYQKFIALKHRADETSRMNFVSIYIGQASMYISFIGNERNCKIDVNITLIREEL